MTEFKPQPEIRLLTVQQFMEELEDGILLFKLNLLAYEKLKAPKSFPEWYETMGAWLEVGTDMEEMYYGKRSV